MRTLLINLTRFGDLLQTQPVISGLAQQGAQVRMVCLQNFGAAAPLLPDLDGAYPLPGASFLAGLEQGWPGALSGFWQWLADVGQDFEPERIVNLTPTLPSRLLLKAVAGRSRRASTLGFGLDEHGFGTNGSRWAVFLQSSSRARGSSPFNLVDIMRRVAGLAPAGGSLRLAGPDKAAQQAAGELLRVAEGRPLVGLQLGASEDRRRWPVEYFARLGDALARDCGVLPVLLGSPAEQELAKRYAALARQPFVNVAGKTGLQELAAVVSRLRLLVSNDTGTMHLAAGLNVPVAALFLATAQPWDTGPYRPDCLCLEPDVACHPCEFGQGCQGQLCRRAITPEALLPSLAGFLQNGRWPGHGVKGARTWLTTVDERGYFDLQRLGSGSEDARTAWMRLQRQVFLGLLDGHTPALPPVRNTAGTAGPQEMFSLLLNQGRLLQAAPKPVLKAKFLGFWQRLLAALEEDARLRVVGGMLVCEMQEHGENLGRLLECLEDYRKVVHGLGNGSLAWHGS